MKARELTQWRQRHPQYTYWCGTLLGGCGERLTDRLYESKVCHFAHHPHHTCTRTANGEDSADHLFMRRALRSWMGSRGLKATVRMPGNAAASGGSIDVDPQGMARRLHFRLWPDLNGSWGPAPGETLPLREEADWIFGLGGAVPDVFWNESGYVFRIRFETRGAERCPYLGVQQRGQATEWTPFSAADLTHDGLATPAVDKIRAASRRARADDKRRSGTERSPEVPPPPVRELGWDELIVALRDALELDARWATKPTLKRLGQTIGVDFTRYDDADLVDLLTEVDIPFPARDPVLSALMRTDEGAPLPYLARVIEGIGLGKPSSAPHLKRWAQREADRAFAKYGVPARTMPPELPLNAAVPQRRTRTPLSPRRVELQGSHQAAGQGSQTPGADEWMRLQDLLAEGQQLAGGAGGGTAARLTQELRAARRLLEGTRRTQLNSRGLRVLRKTSAQLEAAITAARQAAQRSQKASNATSHERPVEEPNERDRRPRDAQLAKAKRPAVPAPDELRQQLIAVAQAGSTTHWLLLSGGKNTAQDVRLTLLTQIENRSGSDAPLLSSLVVAPDGGPVPFFREILRDLGLAVPRSDEALQRIWHREQERAHAAYANPPRTMPARLVPRQSSTNPAHEST
ncbi:competence protein CoiA family protein [Streptomyces sp. NPDC059010]|uniref:competence protein CoiA family protein n=1 Tax=Streptomyces sp. NPDC059010 TaxID=3346695 RepID=UPI00368C40A0